MRHSAVGKSSGARLDHLDAWVFSLRDGRIVRWDAYWDPVEARRALGLQEQALPQENVEIVRTLIGRWNAGDRDLERSSQHVDPAVELEGPLSSLAGELYRGYAGIERWMGDLDQQFAEWQIKVDDLRQVGDGVVAIFTVNARGRASGAPLEFDASALFNFGTDHRLIRAHLYRDVGGALKAVGLEE
jgi:ketosteroid isomerase-like protein